MKKYIGTKEVEAMPMTLGELRLGDSYLTIGSLVLP